MKLLNVNLLKLTALAATIIFPLSNAYTSDREREGGMHGGGGNSVVCFTHWNEKPAVDIANKVKARGYILDSELRNISRIETFDLWEAREEITREDGSKFYPEIIQIEENETWKDYVEKIAGRFQTWRPSVSKQLLKAMDNFETKNISFKETPLKNFDDTDRPSEIAKETCALVTVAKQDKTGTQRILQFDNRLMTHEANKPLSRAVLRLHEIIYSVAREHGHTNSKDTRILVGHLITKNNNITIGEIEKAMKAVGFDDFDLPVDKPPQFVSDLSEALGSESQEILSAKLKQDASANALLTRANTLLNKISLKNKKDHLNSLSSCYRELTVPYMIHCESVLSEHLESFIKNVNYTLDEMMLDERRDLTKEFGYLKKQIVATATSILSQQFLNVTRPKILANPEFSKKTLESIDLAFRKGIEEFYRYYTVTDKNLKSDLIFEIEKFIDYDVVVIDEQ